MSKEMACKKEVPIMQRQLATEKREKNRMLVIDKESFRGARQIYITY